MEKVTENPVKVTTELILEQPAFRKCVLQVNQPQPTQLKENIAGSQELLNSNERSGLTKVKEKMRDQHVISVGFVSKRSRKKFDFFFFFFLLCFLFCDFFYCTGPTWGQTKQVSDFFPNGIENRFNERNENEDLYLYGPMVPDYEE